jgi:hypothetical protein
MSSRQAAGPGNGAAWTVPGAVDESRKGTAAAHPVLVLGGAPAQGALGAEAGSAQATRDERSPEQIEAQLDETRAHLSATLDELSERLSARSLARTAGRGISSRFVDADTGRVRPGRAGAAAGAVAATLADFFALRTSLHRSRFRPNG